MSGGTNSGWWDSDDYGGKPSTIEGWVSGYWDSGGYGWWDAADTSGKGKGKEKGKRHDQGKCNSKSK